MPRTILIVDDVPAGGDTLAIALLSLPGVEIRHFASAEAALEFLAHAADVAALITDLQMPRIDGFELIARVRAEPRFTGLPIVVVSGDCDAATPGRLYRLGADAFFAKPFSPAAIRHTLEQLLYGT